MRAFILAAGMGTRLRPYTHHTPKPLFPVGGRPLIDHTIGQLEKAGFTDIAINLHHLAERIELFVNRQAYRARIRLLHEPRILGTGGGIKNLGDFWEAGPLLVINSDILTDIDLKSVYDDHRARQNAATLVVHDRPEFNSVAVTADNRITTFFPDERDKKDATKLAFTGIQVIEPEFLDFTPEKDSFDSITVYESMIAAGRKVRARRVQNFFWEDLGTPRRYLHTVTSRMAREAFREAFDHAPASEPHSTRLKGDGSDRIWHRFTSGPHTLIAVGHGIRPSTATCEADAFVNIGRHLHRRGLAVPRIFTADPFSGLAFMEDLGDRHLQAAVLAAGSDRERAALYRRVIDKLVALSQEGARGFDPAWPYQTATYDNQVILDYECAYFVEAFLHLKMKLFDITFATFEDEFKALAEKTRHHGINGFMHRDFQSRNIMLRENDCFFIDFQGGRIGPMQYDLASLLIDPYVELSPGLQTQLQDYARRRICAVAGADENTFTRGYRYCCITRSLQILGAFGHLSMNKGKSAFAAYIPPAVNSLKRALATEEGRAFPKLQAVVEQL